MIEINSGICQRLLRWQGFLRTKGTQKPEKNKSNKITNLKTLFLLLFDLLFG